MKTRTSNIIIWGVGAIVVFVLVWIMIRPDQGVENKIRYGYLPISSDASFFVAMEKGYFIREGLEIEPIKFQSSNQALEALVMGRVDATAIVALEAALTLEANTPNQFKIVEMTAATAETRVHRIVVRADSPIMNLGELRGKTIGTFPGSQMMVFLKLVLNQYFDADEELDIIQLKPPLQPQALASGQIDALFCLEPIGTLLEQKGIARSISINPLYEHILQPFPTAVGLVSTKLISERPEVLSKIDKALRSAHEYISTNPNDASLSLLIYTPIEADIAPLISLYDYWDLSEIDVGAVERLVDLFVENNVMTKPVSIVDLLAKLPD